MGATARYEVDFHTWLEEQSACLRAGRLTEIDAGNIAEELGDIEFRLEDELAESLIELVRIFLRLDFEQSPCMPACTESIILRRQDIARLVKRSPGLESALAETLPYSYDIGRLRFLADNEIPENEISDVCPYSIDDLMNRPVQLETSLTRGKRRRARVAR